MASDPLLPYLLNTITQPVTRIQLRLDTSANKDLMVCAPLERWQKEGWFYFGVSTPPVAFEKEPAEHALQTEAPAAQPFISTRYHTASDSDTS